MFGAIQLKLQEKYSTVNGITVKRLFLFCSSDKEFGPTKCFIMVISYLIAAKFKREREKNPYLM